MRFLNLRINFYCRHFFLILVVLFFFVCFVVSSFTTFRPNFTSGLLQVSSGDLPRPRIGMLSLVTVSPVITAFHSCCLSHHVFDQVNLWIWNRYLLTMLTWNRRDSTPLSAAPRAPKGDRGWILWSYKSLSVLPESVPYRIFVLVFNWNHFEMILEEQIRIYKIKKSTLACSSGPVAQRIETLTLCGSRWALSEDSSFKSYPSRPEVYFMKKWPCNLFPHNLVLLFLALS